MKRRISILLSLMLLVASSGFTVSKHYCNGKLVNVFLLPHLGECCDSSMPMDDQSCDNEFIGFYLEEPLELITAKIVRISPILLAQVPEPLLEIVNNSINVNPRRLALTSSPVDNIKIYLRVEAFLN